MKLFKLTNLLIYPLTILILILSLNPDLNALTESEFLNEYNNAYTSLSESQRQSWIERISNNHHELEPAHIKEIIKSDFIEAGKKRNDAIDLDKLHFFYSFIKSLVQKPLDDELLEVILGKIEFDNTKIQRIIESYLSDLDTLKRKPKLDDTATKFVPKLAVLWSEVLCIISLNSYSNFKGSYYFYWIHKIYKGLSNTKKAIPAEIITKVHGYALRAAVQHMIIKSRDDFLRPEYDNKSPEALFSLLKELLNHPKYEPFKLAGTATYYLKLLSFKELFYDLAKPKKTILCDYFLLEVLEYNIFSTAISIIYTRHNVRPSLELSLLIAELHYLDILLKEFAIEVLSHESYQDIQYQKDKHAIMAEYIRDRDKAFGSYMTFDDSEKDAIASKKTFDTEEYEDLLKGLSSSISFEKMLAAQELYFAKDKLKSLDINQIIKLHQALVDILIEDIPKKIAAPGFINEVAAKEYAAKALGLDVFTSLDESGLGNIRKTNFLSSGDALLIALKKFYGKPSFYDLGDYILESLKHDEHSYQLKIAKSFINKANGIIEDSINPRISCMALF
ncbi:MAG: hypothetical protein ABIA04_05315 [Pseudomonadota bacterium]